MDKGSLIYSLPADKEITAKIIDAIPSDWYWINGVLESPTELKVQEEIARTSVLCLGRFHSIKPTIEGITNYGISPGEKGRYLTPNLIDIFCRRKFPVRVVFEQAGFNSGLDLTLEVAKNIAKEFVLLGYTGFISADRRDWDNSSSCIPENFSIWQEGKRSSVNSVKTPPLVELIWDERYSGKRENLESISKKLENLGLKQIRTKSLA